MYLRNFLLLALFIAATNSSSYAQQNNGVFNSIEYKSNELSAFKKWASHNERFATSRKNGIEKSISKSSDRLCRRTKNFSCVTDAWVKLINEIRVKPVVEQLDAINRHLNKASYVTDMVNWQQQDYWATIHQFFNKDGDCEDYAIAKYYSMVELGFSAEKMRIVIVEDTNLNIAHAVLAVYLDGEIWILDNQISTLVPHREIIHYTPLYSINESAWWLHKS